MRGGCKKDDPNGCAVNPRLTKVAMISDMVQNCAQFTREQLLDELKPDKVRLLCPTHHAEHTDEQSRFRINSKDDAARQNDLDLQAKKLRRRFSNIPQEEDRWNRIRGLQ